MKKILLLLSLFCFLPFFAVGCEKKESPLSSYEIDAVFDEEEMSLSCKQKTLFENSTGHILDKLCFFLYANSFEEGQKTVSKSNLDRAYPNGESYGNITFQNVISSGMEMQTSLSQNHNILTVVLNHPLQKEEEITIEMQYVVSLANINHRLGYGDNTINFGSFFPVLCVYEEGDFVKNGFSQAGDPFYSEVANFAVTISYPEDYVIASSGDIISQNQGMTEISAKKVRDFCFVLSKRFEKLTERVNDFEVNYYYFDDEKAKDHLHTSVLAMQTFCEMIGDYPYKQISVVKSDFCFGGMEYPNLVMISSSLASEEEIAYVIVHELAHQWWYSLVGNNQFESAWIDESLTEYSTLLFFEKHSEFGIDYEKSIDASTSSYKQFVKTYEKVFQGVDESMNRPLDKFVTEPEYVNCIYTKGVLMYDSIRERIGKRKFEKCLQKYYQNYKFKIAHDEDVKKCFSQASGRHLVSLFDAWLAGKVRVK